MSSHYEFTTCRGTEIVISISLPGGVYVWIPEQTGAKHGSEDPMFFLHGDEAREFVRELQAQIEDCS